MQDWRALYGLSLILLACQRGLTQAGIMRMLVAIIRHMLNHVYLNNDKPIHIDISYEKNELKKDLVYLKFGQEHFFRYIRAHS